jgi:membrane protein DedA with SNARE-associated domain
MTELQPVKTFCCAVLSALLWNSLIIYIGMKLGDNVELIDRYLSTYRNIILLIMGVIAVILIARHLILRQKSKQ